MLVQDLKVLSYKKFAIFEKGSRGERTRYSTHLDTPLYRHVRPHQKLNLAPS